MFENLILSAVIVFIFGSCIGSFLNVCIFRIPEKKSVVFPGSFCPRCNITLPFYCNLPILSFIFLNGQCKFCRQPISIRYPLIEALTGVMAVALFIKFGLTWVTIFWFVFTSVLITISFIDIDHQIIPDLISLPGIIVSGTSFYFVPEMTLIKVIKGIALGGGMLYSVAAIYYLLKKQEGMGGGDIKLLAMIGAATGIKGVLFTVFTGSLFGTIGGLVAMFLSRHMDSKMKIPFGPFLSLGAILYVFFGDVLIMWYFSLLQNQGG